MLTDFIFSFQRNTSPIDDKNDSFYIHRKSTLNLHHRICNLLLYEEPKIIIETEVKLNELEIWSSQISSFQRNSSS
jgi:hypothetical protein